MSAPLTPDDRRDMGPVNLRGRQTRTNADNDRRDSETDEIPEQCAECGAWTGHLYRGCPGIDRRDSEQREARLVAGMDLTTGTYAADDRRDSECPQCDDSGACNGGPCPLIDRRDRIAEALAVAEQENTRLRAELAARPTRTSVLRGVADLWLERSTTVSLPRERMDLRYRAAELRDMADAAERGES
ncbi:hypothetical protein K378_01366 [Streptomyces sp. Amel2xB2]|uniref:hypothetical protein n=1 Tax=Streptomyces sp. Amel2xB2 TaxID=1305829 RepID=UPI000DB94CC6|nr:hypothetical protein [Streptomyces sp. Amel2xB2]RAJ70201.1 hypothetical protein K378_01366 [Streptomyces sp. Amel2xB2]